MVTDAELLGCYARDRSESAFTELVRRHVDLVYSAALREARGDASLAEDITQAVFAELARKASRLTAHPAPAGWLYTCVRRMTANVRRAENRRRRREQEVHTMNQLLSSQPSDPVWRQIQPVLDDAMHELNDSDRIAVVLRFFEERSLKEVGLALGINENAARMRVDRALDKLHSLLAKRGVTSTAAGLTAAITAGAVLSAPTGLAASVATGALAATAVSTTATIVATKTIAMTTLQKTIIGATLAAAVGTGIFEAHQNSSLRSQNQVLQQQQAPLAEQIRRLQKERDDASIKLAVLQQDDDQLRRDTTELARLRAEISRLRRQESDLSELKDENQRVRTALETPAAPDPATGDAPQLAMRVFSIVSTNFMQNLDLQVQGREDETVTDKLQRFFALNGVKVEPAPRVVLDERSGSVIVASSPTNLYAIEPLIGYLNAAK